MDSSELASTPDTGQFSFITIFNVRESSEQFSLGTVLNVRQSAGQFSLIVVFIVRVRVHTPGGA